MKIQYVLNARFPTEKAHGIQIMKMCEAFADLGHKIELIVPRRFNPIQKDPFEYYSIKKNFSVKQIYSFDLMQFGRVGFIVQSISFSASFLFYSLFNPADLVFSRDELPLLVVFPFRKVAWETHTGSYNLNTKMLFWLHVPVVSITQGLKNFYMQKGASDKEIFVSPDAVDAEQFDINISTEEARRKLNLPKDKKIVLYTGHLYGWKGAHILAKAAKFLPQNIIVAFVGGTDGDIKTFKEEFGQITNLEILGKKPHSDMPLYLKAADILTLPNSPVNDISNLYTSPMKLFEYMAAGKPIIASDLPSIREILKSDHSAVLVPPDDPKALARGIERLISDPSLAEKISRQSHTESKNYTWGNRAQSIISFINSRFR